MFDAERYFENIGVEQVYEGHKHNREGWIQVECPFCTGNPGFHLGFNLNGGYFNCWRCGFKSEQKVVAAFSNVNFTSANDIISLYQSNHFKVINKDVKWGKVKETKLPSQIPLRNIDKKYLKGRGFDPDRLQVLWGLRGSPIIGMYKFRLIIPIYFGGCVVSFQTRDITNKSALRYLSCPEDKEALHHKNILYGLDKCLPNMPIILTEGVFDVWAIGCGAVCSFGISITPEQLNILAKHNKVYVLFDPEKQARQQARTIVSELKMRGVDATFIQPGKKDPADCSRQELQKLLPFWNFRE